MVDKAPPKAIAAPQPPRGLSRFFWRLPIMLYRINVGWLFGKRFLLLNHTGRKSGLDRQAVLEIVRSDESAKIYYVASGFGEKAAWFQNIVHTPQVTIQVQQRQIKALAERLSVQAAQSELEDYARRHPKALQNLVRILGYGIENLEDDLPKLAQLIPIVALHSQD